MSNANLFPRRFIATAHLGLAAVCLLALGSGCHRSPAGTITPDLEAARQIHSEILAKAGQASDASQTEEEQPQATGWATIKGRIVVDGTPPSPSQLNITKDTKECQPGGRPVMSQSIVVGPDGGLVNVALYAVGIKGDNVHESARSPEPGAGEPVVLDNKGCSFVPHVLAFPVGRPLRVTNSDPVGHNAEGKLRMNKTFNVMIAGGSEQTVSTITRAEKIPASVACGVHPWMLGYILPHENGYVDVSGGDGTFEIANLPAGIDLKVQLWHESLKDFGDVKINGEPKPLKRGVLPLKLEPDQTLELTITVPAAALK